MILKSSSKRNQEGKTTGGITELGKAVKWSVSWPLFDVKEEQSQHSITAGSKVRIRKQVFGTWVTWGLVKMKNRLLPSRIGSEGSQI